MVTSSTCEMASIYGMPTPGHELQRAAKEKNMPKSPSGPPPTEPSRQIHSKQVPNEIEMCGRNYARRIGKKMTS